MIGSKVSNDYFEWLQEKVCEDRFGPDISFRRLLKFLHNTSFRWVIPMDSNRAADGEDLRHIFVSECGYEPDAVRYLRGPCTVLEMMVALSIRCETFMDDPQIGNRTSQWFWGMIVSLGLGAMEDSRFDERVARVNINRFMDRDYAPNGEGGLFIVHHCDYDMRDAEIWRQLCWYIDDVYY